MTFEKIKNKKIKILLTILGTFLAPAIAFAVVQTLNGQIGKTQFFANDTNVTITSANNTHSLVWNGVLPVSRGGTGASDFTVGSILFSNGASISQDNTNLFWDDTSNALFVPNLNSSTSLNITSGNGQPININGGEGNLISGNGGNIEITPGNKAGTGVNGRVNINLNQAGISFYRNEAVADFTEFSNNTITVDTINSAYLIMQGKHAPSGNTRGSSLALIGGTASGNKKGGQVDITGGEGGSSNGEGGLINLVAGQGGATGGNGGLVALETGNANGGNGNGGDMEFYLGTGKGSGISGKYHFFSAVSNASYGGILDFESVTADRTFVFPDFSGTFGLLENNQTWTGLNKFESAASSTIYIGSPTKSGCIVLGDSDGSGLTYVTANDGILIATTIKPDICQ